MPGNRPPEGSARLNGGPTRKQIHTFKDAEEETAYEKTMIRMDSAYNIY
jgi:hypothetical protein